MGPEILKEVGESRIGGLSLAEAEHFGTVNEYDLYAGMSFTTSRPVVITHLGRFKHVSGGVENHLKHELKLFRQTNPRENEPQWAQVAWAVVDMSQTPVADDDGFVYTELATPVRLEDGETYILVSHEYWFGGDIADEYYHGEEAGDSATLPILTYPSGSGITLIGAGRFYAGTRNWTQVTNQYDYPNRCYGPLNLKYQ